jgi:Phage derived protein Gp49-like (DUF891)
MPVLWAIRCYTSARGVDEIRAWYDQQSPVVRAKFLSRLQFLAQTPRPGWKREPFDLLKGRYGELGEIRFKADRIQYRPLGFFSPGSTFTLVICAQEKNSRFVPKNAPDIALARKREIEADAKRSRACDFPLE